ncbi:MAG: MFS transporter [Halobacteria archaeon]
MSEPHPAADRVPREFRRNVAILGLVSFFNDFGSEMALPLLPFFLLSLGATPAHIGLMEGAALGAVYFATLPAGLLSDRLVRRKPVVVAGYAVAALSRAGFVAATHWTHLLAARLSDRVGKGLRGPPRDALVAESEARARWGRAFGLQRALDTAGAVAGSVCALLFLAAGADYRAVFLVALAPSLLSVLLLLGVRETGSGVRRRERLPRRPVGPELKRFMGVALLYAAGSLGAVLLLLRASELGASPAAGAGLYILFNVAGAALAYPTGRLSDRVGRRRAVLLCLLVQAAAMGSFAAAPPGLLLAPLFLLAGFAYEFFQTSSRAYVADLAPPERRATFFGGYQVVLGAGTVAGGAAAGALWAARGAEAAFGLAAGLVLLSALVLATGRKRENFNPPPA